MARNHQCITDEFTRILHCVVNTDITTCRIRQSLPSTFTCKSEYIPSTKHLIREIHSKSRLCGCDWAPPAGLVFRKRLKRTGSRGENSCDSDRKLARWRFCLLKPRFFPNVAASSPCSREATSDRLKFLRRRMG